MKTMDILDILKKVSDDGVGGTHRNGFTWLKNTFIPSLQFAETHFQNEQFLLADCYYVLGDIHDFNDAPKAAIEAYVKAVEFDPQMASAYRELANMYNRIGEYDQAGEAIAKALTLDSEDSYARADLAEIQENLQISPSPLFDPSDLVWQCNEYLAGFQPEKALAVVHEVNTLEATKARARCFGALSNHTQYLQEWRTLLQDETEFTLAYNDWFYLPEELTERIEIWELLLQMNERIKPSIFLSYDSLWESEAYRALSDKERRHILMQFMIDKNTQNMPALCQLYKTYPQWVELGDTIKELTESRDEKG